ncbi:MAG: hypothetical protein NTV49_05300, partial [Kiritimatiellaeota bacterium]|nr:hypothetical protein [Kiritimatiellota bacterium]
MKAEPETLFLLGAGFTRAAMPKCPLNAELVQALSKLPRSIIPKYGQRYETDDIEVLLTRLDLEAGHNHQAEVDRCAINGDLASFFSQFRITAFGSKAPSWLNAFIKEVVCANDALVSLNYDCFLEGALDTFGVWSPYGGYARIQNSLCSNIPPNPHNIRVYKIHGSENFIESSAVGNNPAQTGLSFRMDAS